MIQIQSKKYNTNNLFKLLTNFIILVALIAFVISCARPMAPTGGPKDETPPIALKSKPVNYSTNFNDDKIIILFDEFIKLENVTQELLVSPPLEEAPEIKLRGKNIIIKLQSKLNDSTTYGINFYESITDLNEGNLLKNFQFEFSTGNNFDSLYVVGKAKNAFNYKSDKGVYVMLYEAFNDSTPRTTKPAYISKTDEKGNFIITNLKNKPYYIFALNDLNNNSLFDLPNEQIAFLNQSIQPKFKQVEMVDTIQYIDSISANLKDTLFADSLHRHMEWVTTIDNIKLFLFEEDVQQQYFIDAYRPEREQVIFSFNTELSDSFKIIPQIDTTIANTWYKQEYGKLNDSLIYWISDSNIYNNDSLFFELNYTKKDSNGVYYVAKDTVLLAFSDDVVEPEKGKKEKNKKERKFNLSKLTKKESIEKVDTIIKSELTVSSNAKTSFDLNKQIELVTRFPIKQIVDTAFHLNKIIDDTVITPINRTITIDTNQIRNINIAFEKDEEESFELFIPAGSIQDIYGNVNDTLKYNFKTQALSYYGTLQLNIIGVKNNAVIQLLNNKEKLIEERFINSDTILEYKYLYPKNIIFKLFYDNNSNKKWDTGNYKDLLQPEEVFYFPEEISIKSNFDYDYEWNLYPKVASDTINNKANVTPLKN